MLSLDLLTLSWFRHRVLYLVFELLALHSLRVLWLMVGERGPFFSVQALGPLGGCLLGAAQSLPH